jgi:hypothetical protein
MNETHVTKKQIFHQFIDLYFQLLDLMKEAVGNHQGFKYFYKKNLMLKSTNIKRFIKTWYESITKIHFETIMSSNIEYFLKHGRSFLPNESFAQYFEEFKDYCMKTEVSVLDTAYTIVKNLTTLSWMYYTNNC